MEMYAELCRGIVEGETLKKKRGGNKLRGLTGQKIMKVLGGIVLPVPGKGDYGEPGLEEKEVKYGQGPGIWFAKGNKHGGEKRWVGVV